MNTRRAPYRPGRSLHHRARARPRWHGDGLPGPRPRTIATSRIKVLRPELTAILGAERFLQEIRLTARLAHPHILPLLDSGDAGGFLYYVAPYVEGGACGSASPAGPAP